MYRTNSDFNVNVLTNNKGIKNTNVINEIYKSSKLDQSDSSHILNHDSIMAD